MVNHEEVIVTDKAQEKAIEFLSDWVKWLVATNLGAVTGCVLVLQGDVSGASRFFLVLAIGSFTLSLLAAAALLGFTPSLIQRLPLQNERGAEISIYDARIWAGMRLKMVLWVQSAFFLAAVAFFMGWVLFSA